MARILLVDDEPHIVELLEACCQDAGYETITATDGREGLRLFFQNKPDLVIADIRMPVMNGFDLCRRIREVSEVPIIVLSALGEEDDKVEGLQAGADDYLVKPVGPRELVARIEAALRRARLPPLETKGVYSDTVLTIDMDRQEAYVRGQKVHLTPKELRLLIYLTQRQGRVASIEELLTTVWGSAQHSRESLKWHIANLRQKIEDDPEDPRLIVTVWGSGYRYDKPVAKGA